MKIDTFGEDLRGRKKMGGGSEVMREHNRMRASANVTTPCVTKYQNH